MIPLERRKELLTVIDYPNLSLRTKCSLLEVCRSSIYYQKIGKESDLNLEIMEQIDRMYLEHPEFGAERMHTWLLYEKGYNVNLKRIERLYYDIMGLRSLMPGPHTSTSRKEHKKYPYLLKGLVIIRCNQVWMTDITYIPMEKGYMYVMAIIDVFSRKILHWGLSNTMDSIWCCTILEECINIYGTPQILNTDQGSQFTSDDFVYRVLNNQIKLSMDSKGRAIDNIYIERFWRTLKYEHIYIRPSSTVAELWRGIDWFINWYNNNRRHTELNNQTPGSIFDKQKSNQIA
ncbi:MAG TPA: IS3 family transposase [Saprospiraceae bacterium]|nr:IS3 family transposase [Saprospiraceae bacterium]